MAQLCVYILINYPYTLKWITSRYGGVVMIALYDCLLLCILFQMRNVILV